MYHIDRLDLRYHDYQYVFVLHGAVRAELPSSFSLTSSALNSVPSFDMAAISLACNDSTKQGSIYCCAGCLRVAFCATYGCMLVERVVGEGAREAKCQALAIADP